MEIAANKNVLRCMIGLSKAERKKFRDAERLRIENMSGIAIGKPPPAKDMVIYIFIFIYFYTFIYYIYIYLILDK